VKRTWRESGETPPALGNGPAAPQRKLCVIAAQIGGLSSDYGHSGPANHLACNWPGLMLGAISTESFVHRLEVCVGIGDRMTRQLPARAGLDRW
jgi:hypothetical protein